MFGISHPVWLLGWIVALVCLIRLPWPAVGWVCLLVLALGSWLAAASQRRLLRRSRWLLLAVFVLFGWMTPGLPVVWLPGATGDGLLLAVEQLARLTTSISMVAILLSQLDTLALMTALYGLLRPLAVVGIDADRLILRLALILRQLEGGQDAIPAMVHLPQVHWRVRDRLAVAGLLIVLVGAMQ